METEIRLPDLIFCLSQALDLVSPAIVGHHKRVAYIASNLATEIGLPKNEQSDILIAGLLHDAGALTLKERIDPLQFEFDYKAEDPHRHALCGYLLLKNFQPLSQIATLIRFHHVSWNDGQGCTFNNEKVPLGSHILHLADRIDILINRNLEILGQAQKITRIIEERAGQMFIPEFMQPIKKLAIIERFWLDPVSSYLDSLLLKKLNTERALSLGPGDLAEMVQVFSHIIDFRSRFTVTHSTGVAASAEILAKLFAFSGDECRLMHIAGLLHDLGKLAVPAEILEKPNQLTPKEMNIIKSHTFHSYRILEKIEPLRTINEWGSFHHERLNGRGYPFHLNADNLSLGSRIMCVADVFTALNEDRPYRKGMTAEKALSILKDMAKNSTLDSAIVNALEQNFEMINSLRVTAQQEEFQKYQKFMQKKC